MVPGVHTRLGERALALADRDRDPGQQAVPFRVRAEDAGGHLAVDAQAAVVRTLLAVEAAHRHPAPGRKARTGPVALPGEVERAPEQQLAARQVARGGTVKGARAPDAHRRPRPAACPGPRSGTRPGQSARPGGRQRRTGTEAVIGRRTFRGAERPRESGQRLRQRRAVFRLREVHPLAGHRHLPP